MKRAEQTYARHERSKLEKPNESITNAEHSRALTEKEIVAGFKKMAAKWEAAKAIGKEAAQAEITGINLLREVGLWVQVVSNHEQLGFNFYHKRESQFPKDMSFRTAQVCVGLYRKFPNPITTIDEARPARQMLFEAVAGASVPKRVQEQNSHVYNPWDEFVSKTMSLTSLFKELGEENMEQWELGRLKDVVRVLQPAADKHAEAMRLADEREKALRLMEGKV